MMTEKKNYISLEGLLARNESFSANKKFFELLEKHKNGKRKDFILELNEWVEKDRNKQRSLNFSEFHFDISNEEIKEKFSILILDNSWNFSDFIFPNMSFIASKFNGKVSFLRSKFDNRASFGGVIFNDRADFNSASFNGDTSFSSAKFNGKSTFEVTKFNMETNFHKVNFSLEVSFLWTKFSGWVYFDLAEFNRKANFSMAQFSNRVYFHINKSTEEISLISTQFDDNVYFSKEFLYQANLDEVIIDIAKINIPNKINISKVKKDSSNYRVFRRYYAHKLDHELERKYFALELESKPFPKIKKIEKWPDVKNWLFYPFELIKYLGYRIITFLYKWTSDYGNSIFRPVIAVLAVYLFTILTASDLAFGTGFVHEILGKYSKILLTHIPFGYGVGDDDKIYQYSSDWMKFLNGIIMYVGLFLMGLAARNRFRIK